MKSVNSKLIIIFVAVIALGVYIKVNNPHRQYSTEQFWMSATVDDVFKVPDEALAPGNRNGSVLMWASMATQDPKVVHELVRLGAEINKVVGSNNTTPLIIAAELNPNPDIIEGPFQKRYALRRSKD